MLDTVLFGIGSVSVLGQVVIFREWMVAGFGVELVCVLALGAWLLLNASGVFLAASGRSPNLSASLFLACFGMAAGMVLIRSLRNLAGLPPGTYPLISVFLPAVFITLLPLCMFLGAAFQRAADLGIPSAYGSLEEALRVADSGDVFHLAVPNVLHAVVRELVSVIGEIEKKKAA